MRYVFGFFWLIVILLGVTFAILNPHSVNVNYLLNSRPIHLPILLLFTLLMGSFLGLVAMLPAVLRNKRSNSHLRARVKEAEHELQNLRTIPIKERCITTPNT
jgi:putative membrane protein